MGKYFDKLGNAINVGDEILVKDNKSDRTYRRGIVLDFKNDRIGYNDIHTCDVLIKYDDGRLYCNKYPWDMRIDDTSISFSTKLIKVWRSSHDIIKLKSEYLS